METKLTLRNYIIESLQMCIGTFFGSMVLVAIVTQFYELSKESRFHLFLITLPILLTLYIVYRKKYYLEKEVWMLKNHILTRGKPINTTFDLNTIEFMTFGIPQPKWVSFITKFSFTSGQEILKHSYISVLTIKFIDNTYLILNVVQQNHLLEIINQILVDHQDKMVENYIFTEDEIQILKVRKSNRLLK